MKENIRDISADIELQYGQPNMERNIAYVLSLVEARVMEDGRLNDDIPVPSIEAAAKNNPSVNRPSGVALGNHLPGTACETCHGIPFYPGA